MLTSLALIFLLGLFFGHIFIRLRLPALLGMLLTGIVLGPYVLNLIDGSLLAVSADLRQIALIIILTRAGLSLNLQELKRVGRPAILLSFVPASLEILAMLFFAPRLLGISLLEASLMGAVLAAVSPAVIVPRMLKLMDTGYGTDQSIPQMIMAGASVDDIFVIVLFTVFAAMADGRQVSLAQFASIPVSIVLGIVLGIGVGLLLSRFFKRFHMRDSVKIILLLCVAFLLLELQKQLADYVAISALLAVMTLGVTMLRDYPVLAKRLSLRYEKLWVTAEVILFVLVGAAVDVRYAAAAGGPVILLILAVLLFRMVGVAICVAKTTLTTKERLFCALAYVPKATVQAAIGGIPLAMGLPSGPLVLTVAVTAILLTAPLGALAIDRTYKKLLQPAAGNEEA
ncbi:MAG: sodium:proton antiporter [Clostridiaceae bacterium]|nr:sodium:proton antiporter [Clostridiaceae bacterium]